MTFTQNLVGVRPPARFDGIPWVSMIIQESSTPTGPWTTIDTVQLPTEPTPESPAVVTATTTLATSDDGFFRVSFKDAVGVQSPPSPAVYSPERESLELPPDLRMPTVADLGAMLRGRTKDNFGNEVGTFNADTRPTASQVAALITLAAADVTAKVAHPIVDPYGDAARSAIALRAAMLIEVSYFPEETESRDSAFGRFERQYRTAVDELGAALRAREIRII